MDLFVLAQQWCQQLPGISSHANTGEDIIAAARAELGAIASAKAAAE